MRKLLRSLLVSLSVLSVVVLNSAVAQADGIVPYGVSNCTTLRIVAVPSSSLSAIFSGDGSFGHAFLIVNNDLTSGFTVAGLTVPVGGQVTVGTFGNRTAGAGVYLNIEAYYATSTDGRVSLSACITTSQLVTLNAKISASNSWTTGNNCSWFAATVWNAVVTDQQVNSGVPGLSTPNDLIKSIKAKTTWYTNTPYSSTSASNVYRLQSNNVLISASPLPA
ncbi:MAG: hypothetical protein LBE83_10470 [Propionibacteriaceae bacterium]|jgi:hypothetical protein|nr:hypothetical protein [Propionibacteriaceae bacterium]